MVLPCMVHSLRETWKLHLVPASLETLKFIPDYVLDTRVKQSTQKVLMLLREIGKLQPYEVASMMSVSPACSSFWAVTGQTAVKAQKNILRDSFVLELSVF